MAVTSNDKQSGFTLVELMITLLISSIVLGSVFIVYSNQQKTYVDSEHLADMQQNLRAALLIMTSEIREAGCDPTEKSGAGIVSASKSHFRFTRDIAGHGLAPGTRADGDLDDGNEDVEFGFSTAQFDANSDGIVDGGGVGDLGRQTGGAGGFQPIAENIQAIEFAYILEDGTIVSAPTLSQLNQIRAVQVSILARSGVEDPKYTNTVQYRTITGANWGPFNDNYKRRFASITIQCRNLGMTDVF